MGIYERIMRYSDITPEKVAIKCDDECVSYQMLRNYVSKACLFLDGLHLKKNEPIGSLFSNSIEFVVVLLACCYKKHPCVLFSDNMSKAEVSQRAELLGIRYLLTSENRKNCFMEYQKIPFFNDIICVFYEKKCEDEFEEEDFICQFTSGTNNAIKAVVRTEKSVILEIECILELVDIGSDDIVLTLPPICHSYGLIGGTLLPLIVGSTIILTKKFIPRDALNIINKEKITSLFAVPYIYQLFVSTVEEHNFDSLRLCFSAGAHMTKDLGLRVKKLFGIPVFQDYGSTETGTISINNNPSDFPESVGALLSCHSLILKPLKEEVMDGSSREKEIWLRSCAIARAYLYPRELNKKKFVNSIYCTGDTGWIENGKYLYLSGRKNRFINVAGLKVDPKEVQNVIAQIPEVKEVEVVSEMGLATEIIKAIVVTKKVLQKETIISHCKEHLPAYKIPRIISFVDTIEKNEMGKIINRKSR